jgi:hypothetical protein
MERSTMSIERLNIGRNQFHAKVYKRGSCQTRTVWQRTTGWILAGTMLMLNGWAQASCEQVDLLYNQRYPYLYKEGDHVRGLTADPASQAFQAAGIPFAWKLIPSKRQMLYLQENQDCLCLVGWFKNAEREAFGLYTKSIYQDLPQVALTWAGHPKLKAPLTTETLFSDAELRPLIKNGYSYGQYLDQRLPALQSRAREVTWENAQMLKSIFLKHYDYFIIAPEEASALIQASEYPQEHFALIKLTDLMASEKRYIVCSRRVGSEIIERLNRHIAD